MSDQMKRKAILLMCPILASPGFAAESSILREIMGEEVYQQSGVQELSEQQIDVLERWVLDNTDYEVGVGESPAVAEAPEESDRSGDIIRSRIDGPFKGWRDNGTRFRLENGQIWEQRQASTFITDLDSPEVIIRRNRFGHTMEVPLIDRKVHVKRVR